MVRLGPLSDAFDLLSSGSDQRSVTGAAAFFTSLRADGGSFTGASGWLVSERPGVFGWLRVLTRHSTSGASLSSVGAAGAGFARHVRGFTGA